MQALSGSGISCMSDSWIAFQPAIEEPSNMIPSLNVSSSTVETSEVTCCHLPRGSVKRKSTYFTTLSLIIFKASLAVVMELPFSQQHLNVQARPDQRFQMASNPDSPVLIRMASSILETKIFPSPIRPV